MMRLLIISVCLCAFVLAPAATEVACVLLEAVPSVPHEDESEDNCEELVICRFSTRKRGSPLRDEGKINKSFFSPLQLLSCTSGNCHVAFHNGHELSNGMLAPLLI